MDLKGAYLGRELKKKKRLPAQTNLEQKWFLNEVMHAVCPFPQLYYAFSAGQEKFLCYRSLLKKTGLGLLGLRGHIWEHSLLALSCFSSPRMSLLYCLVTMLKDLL